MTYPNLKAEMKRSDITGKDIAQCLGVTSCTVSKWINGADSAFPIIKAKQIRDEFFTGQSLDYLFSDTPTLPMP